LNSPGLSGSAAVLFGYLAAFQVAYASPQGGNIVGGTGSINQSGLTTNIQQNTQKLAIDWQSYNLNSNEKVNYLQPNSSSIVLNRVLGGSASQIFGQINANGQVVLVNPNGILL
jgi:filamentous hemagglutinin family protein